VKVDDRSQASYAFSYEAAFCVCLMGTLWTWVAIETAHAGVSLRKKRGDAAQSAHQLRLEDVHVAYFYVWVSLVFIK
jgi:hypothetical protein